jgi:hypothetical protein
MHAQAHLRVASHPRAQVFVDAEDEGSNVLVHLERLSYVRWVRGFGYVLRVLTFTTYEFKCRRVLCNDYARSVGT